MPESRLKPGVDVPWMTSWSEEEGLGVRPCPSIGGRLAVCQVERPGFGRPQYSMNHFRRQREAVIQMRCPMCGEPTPDGDRWTQIAHRKPAAALRAKGLGGYLPPALPDDQIIIDAGSIPPLHEACARHSMEHCPHLRAQADAEVRPFPAQWIIAPLMVQVVAPPAPLAVLTTRPAPPPPAVVGFMQIFGLTEERGKSPRRTGRTRLR
ncbi:hypothetical protein [Caulobacter sp.]|uniref:hypothetical protein n=1 Tax=Caulobacter sp. TaxID=78 RepID=UPI003BAC7911